MQARKSRGFTLLELMTVVAIIGVLAALAIYNYSRYGYRARRADGREMVMRVASALERYYTNFNQYTNGVTTAPPTGLGFTTANSEKGYYTISVTLAAANQGYTITATPVSGGAQAKDQCKNLTLDNAGNKAYSGNTGNGPCW